MSLIEKTEAYVREAMRGNDMSHDFNHVERVRSLALRLAREEGIENEDDLLIVELAALLHDVADWKYSGSETAGTEAARKFLSDNGITSDKIDRVCRIIDGVSFKNELGTSSEQKSGIPLEIAVVQDADRLDAIGAVGIARTFAYAGKKRTRMYIRGDEKLERHTLTKSEYMNRQKLSPDEQSSTRHFYEKLLNLKDMLKTESGRKIGEKRHRIMEVFLDDLFEEAGLR